MSIRKVEMNARQTELLNAAYTAKENSRESRELNLLLEGMAATLGGKLLNANTDLREFTLEVPDIPEQKEA